MADQLKRGRIVLGGGGRASTQPTRGMGCMCTGPAYGTPYCPCTLAWMQGQVDDEGDDDFEEEE